MMYLHPEEWAEFLRQLPSLRAQLRSRQQSIDELDETGAKMREYRLRRQYVPDKYDEKRIGKGQNGRMFLQGGIPPKVLERRTRLSTTELDKYNKGEWEEG